MRFRWVPTLAMVGWLAASAVHAAAEDQPAPPDASFEQDGTARTWHLTPELHMSAFTNQADRGNLAVTFGWGLRAGHRWGDWGVYGQVEHSAWYATEFERHVTTGVVNVAAGGERLFAKGFIRTALALGVSVLTFDTPLDAAGTSGVFFDLRPLGLRWQLTDALRLVLDPLHLSVMAPALGSPPLVRILYRTTIGLEILP